MERDGKRWVMREREREGGGGETNNTLLEGKYVTYRSIVHKLLHRVFLSTEMKHTRTQVTLFSYMYMYNHTTITLLRDLSLFFLFGALPTPDYLPEWSGSIHNTAQHSRPHACSVSIVFHWV